VTFAAADAYHPLLLVDDLTESALVAVLDRFPGAAVETSPGNFQATLVASRPLANAERLAVQRELARRFGGDSGATGGMQLRRVPGSLNYKPTLAKPFAARLFGEPEVGVVGATMLAELLAGAAAEQTASSGAVQAPREARLGADESRDDFVWVMGELRRFRGARGEALVLALTDRAVARHKYGGDRAAVLEYARRTVNAVHDTLWAEGHLARLDGLRGEALVAALAERVAARGQFTGDQLRVCDYARRTVQRVERRRLDGRAAA
jgi:hypothetical protein